MDQNNPKQLVRGLSLSHTMSLVVGGVIGTGIFLKTSIMAIQAQRPWLLLLAWVVAGCLSIAGALAYAELGSKMPNTGGEYVYLRTAYGKPVAFLYGWMRFIVGGPGSIAAYAIGMTLFMKGAFPWLEQNFFEFKYVLFGTQKVFSLAPKHFLALGIIWFFTLLNCFRVRFGGTVQIALTVLKILGVCLIVGGVFFFSKKGSWQHFSLPHGLDIQGVLSGSGCNPTGVKIPAFGFWGIGAAVISALWAYDGWNQMPMAAGEVSNPKRNIPRALVLGMLIVMGMYLLANVAYLYALPFGAVLTSKSNACGTALPIAQNAAATFLGVTSFLLPWVALIFILSSVGALNGSILTSARVPFAMAQDGLFFRSLTYVHPKTHVPVFSVLLQGLIANVLALSGGYDSLTDMVVFAFWIFYGLSAFSVFLLRGKQPDLVSGYRTWGYPVTPVLFILGAVVITVISLKENTTGSLTGMVLMGSGIPIYLYFYFKNKANKSSS